MTKFLIFIAVLYLIYRLTRPKRSIGEAKSPPQKSASQMIRCDLCGIFIPEQESVRGEKHAYCCEDHRQKAGRKS